MLLAYIVGIIAGAAATFQVSVNDRIRARLGSLYATTLLSFVVSASLVSILLLVTGDGMDIPLAQIAREPFWIWLGGSCGTLIIMQSVLCLPHLGSAWNVTIVCFGQVMTGLIIDHFGLFRSPVVPMTAARAAGAAIVMAGIVLVSLRPGKRGDKSAGAHKDGIMLYWILALIGGAACALQIAFNGALKEVAGSAGKATLVSMSSGFITTLAVTLAVLLIKGRDALRDNAESGERRPLISSLRPWMVFGGALAAVVVGGNAIAAPVAGTGMVTIMNLIGMMGTGLIVDATGFLGIEKKPVTIAKAVGMILMIIGTGLISF